MQSERYYVCRHMAELRCVKDGSECAIDVFQMVFLIKLVILDRSLHVCPAPHKKRSLHERLYYGHFDIRGVFFLFNL